MKRNAIDLEKSTVALRSDGILHIHLKSGSNIQIDDARLIFEAMGQLGKGKKCPVLIDAGHLVQVDPEVKKFSASTNGNLYTIADAIACYSLGQKILAAFYIKQNNPVVPTRSFSSKEAALGWLNTFLAKSKC